MNCEKSSGDDELRGSEKAAGTMNCEEAAADHEEIYLLLDGILGACVVAERLHYCQDVHSFEGTNNSGLLNSFPWPSSSEALGSARREGHKSGKPAAT